MQARECACVCKTGSARLLKTRGAQFLRKRSADLLLTRNAHSLWRRSVLNYEKEMHSNGKEKCTLDQGGTIFFDSACVITNL